MRALVGALLLGAVFVTALLGGLLLHLGTPPARRVLASALSEGLSALFVGEVTVSHLDVVGPSQLAARGVVVRDPEGVVVLEIGRLRVNARGFEIARRALLGTGKQTLVIDHVRADEVTCAVLTDAQSGSPSIARAFQPAPSSRSSEPSAASAREIRVWLPHVEIGRGSARGDFPGLAAVEQICAVDGLTGIYTGPADLALSLGFGIPDALRAPEMLDAIDHIGATATAAGLVAGIHAGTGPAGRALAARGY
ncbi:MAG TPA: aldolase/citrate lyase family protein, partial [Polyangiaceae bacterium]|nr:aldolase/citrate lyase family protein [Polyangiaceae bacterium]